MSAGNGSGADTRPVLVTGGAGFIGSNIADRLAGDGHDVIVYDALSRPGVDTNLAWLQQRHPGRIHPIIADIRDGDRLRAAVRDAKAVFHMAAQVAVTTSLADPRDDFTINLAATFDLLEAVRAAGRPIPLVFASTNKVYGDLTDLSFVLEGDSYVPVADGVRRHGIGEDRPLDFHTPYGCSKGAADQYVLDYARSYGMPAAVLRMSCIYGRRQMGTEDQGWVAHFLIRALMGEAITLYGDGYQVRDILDVSDAVDAYMAVWAGSIASRAAPSIWAAAPRTRSACASCWRRSAPSSASRSISASRTGARATSATSSPTPAPRPQHSASAPSCPGGRGVANLATWLAEARGLPLPAMTPPPERITVAAGARG
jgi:CDP-paratose 2-epimerase